MEEEDELLLPRAARLKPEERAALGLAPDDDESSSDDSGDDSDGGGGGGGHGAKRGKKSGGGGKRGGGKKGSGGGGGGHKRKHAPAPGGGEPGPAIEGAALRVDEWLLDVDEEGRPLQVCARWRRSHTSVIFAGPVPAKQAGPFLFMHLFILHHTHPGEHPGADARAGRAARGNARAGRRRRAHAQPARRGRVCARGAALRPDRAAAADCCRGKWEGSCVRKVSAVCALHLLLSQRARVQYDAARDTS